MESLVVDIDTAKPQKASLIAELARKLKSKVTFTDGAYMADARSYLELLLLWSSTKSHKLDVANGKVAQRLQLWRRYFNILLKGTLPVMTYYYAREIEASFDEVEQRVREALKEQGFGVLTEIDVQETLKKKLNVDIPKIQNTGGLESTIVVRIPAF